MIVLFIGIFIVIGAISMLVFREGSEQGEPVSIHIDSYSESVGERDSDGDGVPDWLEEVTGSDVHDAASFPYQRDIALAKQVTSTELVHEGPGEFAREIIRRMLFDINDAGGLTPEEREQFIATSSEYFLEKMNERSLPEVHLRIDDEVVKSEVLADFTKAMYEMQQFKRPIGIYIEEIFTINTNTLQGKSVNTSALREAIADKQHCVDALDTFPRAVPAEVFPPYSIVLERVTYLCEALSIAVSSRRSEDYFYILFLLNAGTLFNPSPEGDTVQKQVAVVNQRFMDALAETLSRLQP